MKKQVFPLFRFIPSQPWPLPRAPQQSYFESKIAMLNPKRANSRSKSIQLLEILLAVTIIIAAIFVAYIYFYYTRSQGDLPAEYKTRFRFHKQSRIFYGSYLLYPAFLTCSSPSAI